MTREQLVERCRAAIAAAYDDAVAMIVAYLEQHPRENLRALCREISEEDGDGLRQRVLRTRKGLKARTNAGSSGSRHKSKERTIAHLSVISDEEREAIEEEVQRRRGRRTPEEAERRSPDNDLVTAEIATGQAHAHLGYGSLHRIDSARLNARIEGAETASSQWADILAALRNQQASHQTLRVVGG